MKQETLEEVAEKRYPEDGSFVVMDIDIAEYQQLAFIDGTKWQQEQDNKELGMWKLAVERQEARCKALHSVISDLQEKNKYSEEDMRKAIQETITLMRYKATEFREHENTVIEQFKKK